MDLIGLLIMIQRQLGDLFKIMFSDLFNGFLTSFQAKQEQQDNLLIYLPLFIILDSICLPAFRIPLFIS